MIGRADADREDAATCHGCGGTHSALFGGWCAGCLRHRPRPPVSASRHPNEPTEVGHASRSPSAGDPS